MQDSYLQLTTPFADVKSNPDVILTKQGTQVINMVEHL